MLKNIFKSEVIKCLTVKDKKNDQTQNVGKECTVCFFEFFERELSCFSIGRPQLNQRQRSRRLQLSWIFICWQKDWNTRRNPSQPPFDWIYYSSSTIWPWHKKKFFSLSEKEMKTSQSQLNLTQKKEQMLSKVKPNWKWLKPFSIGDW